MIKPLKDKILIEFIQGKDITNSGIIIAHKEEEKPQIAKVIEVGEKATQLIKGDTIIVSRYVGDKVNYENKEYIIIKERDVLAKISNIEEENYNHIPTIY